MANSKNQRYGSNQDESSQTASQTRDYNTRNYTTAGEDEYSSMNTNTGYASSASFGGSDDRNASRSYGSSYSTSASPSESFGAGQDRYGTVSGTGTGSMTGTGIGGSFGTSTSGYGTGAASGGYGTGTSNYGTGSAAGGYGSAGTSTSTGYTGGMATNYGTQQTGYQTGYAGQNAGNYGVTSAQTGLSGYGAAGTLPASGQLQTNLATNPQANLTQAGVSNFSQQINSAYQQLQQVQRELIQTQNQIEVQAQAQIRQLRQLQQLIENAGSEVQQIDSLARLQSGNRSYPLS